MEKIRPTVWGSSDLICTSSPSIQLVFVSTLRIRVYIAACGGGGLKDMRSRQEVVQRGKLELLSKIYKEKGRAGKLTLESRI